MKTADSRPRRRAAPTPLLGRVVLLCCYCCLVAAPTTADSKAGLHADFDRFLQRHVSESGTIDYALARDDSADLDRYVAWLVEVSPDNRAELFPRREDQLAYWINAYNAWVIRKVLDHYPISSVKDVQPPGYFFFLPRVAGFFVFEEITLGGDRMSLRALENGIVRKRFAEPRIHFALNCASIGCPRLPSRAFGSEELEKELERETRRFLSDSEKLRIDTDARMIEVSSIFDWYEDDFKQWMKRLHPNAPATLQGYLAASLPERQAELLRACDDCPIEFIDYDWGLNDRSPGASAANPNAGLSNKRR
jgi:hypothetical protein